MKKIYILQTSFNDEYESDIVNNETNPRPAVNSATVKNNQSTANRGIWGLTSNNSAV